MAKETEIQKDLLVNDEINAPNVHLIMNDGRSGGVVSLDQARYLAAQHTLDLVEINSNSNPPIVKLLDYSKYRYQQEKQSRQAQRNRGGGLKEMRLSFSIDEHDLEAKAKRVREFLAQGNLVRVFINLRGRENVFPEKAKKTLMNFQEKVEAVIEQPISHIGKRLQIIIKPKK